MNNKKKAIKIATATAIVASGFVAVAPAQAAVSVADTVANAKKVMAIPYKTYTTASFLANPKVVEDQVKAAKTAYNNAVKVVNKSGGTKKAAYLSQLKTANVNVTRADGYTKAHRIAEKDKKTLEKDLASLNQSAVDQKAIEVKDKYNAILKTVKTARTSIEKVYGTQVKLNLKSKFTVPTEKALEGDIKVYYFYQKAEAWLAKGEIETAEARVKEIAPLFEKVGKTTDLEKAIHAYAESVSKKIEDAKTPVVTGVSAIGAKKLEVKFSGKAVDTTKAKVEVQKGNSTYEVAAAWSADKKSVVLESAGKFAEGTYTVTVSGVTETALTGTVEVKAEALKEIKILSDNAPLKAAGSDVVVVGYQLLNQYGEDVTKDARLGNSDNFVKSSVGTVDMSQGVIEIDTGIAGLKAGDKVPLTLVDKATTISVSKTLTVASEAKVAQADITSVYNEDKKAVSVDNSDEDFFLLLNAVDQYGNVVKGDIKSDITVVSSNPSVADIVRASGEEVVTGNLTDDKLIGLQLDINGAGETVFTVISNSTGKSTTYKVTVEAGLKVDTVEFGTPEGTIAGDETVLIPATVLDNKGNQIKDARSSLLSGLTPSVQNADSGKWVTKDGNLFYSVDTDSVAAQSTKSLVLTLTTPTNKVTTKILTVKPDATPVEVANLVADQTTSILGGKSETIDLDEVLFFDQYGRSYDASEEGAFEGYTLNISSSDESVLTVDGNELVAQQKKGSSTVTFELERNSDGKVLSSFTKRFNVVVQSEFASYELASIPTMFATADDSYFKEVKVYGVTASGQKVKLDSNYFNIIDGALEAQAADNGVVKVSAEGVTFSSETNTAESKEVTLKVVINATGAELTTKVNVSEEAAKVASISFTDNGTALGKAITAADLNVTNNFDLADLNAYTVITDQYGVNVVDAGDDLTFGDATTGSNALRLTVSNFAEVGTPNIVPVANGTNAAYIEAAQLAVDEKFDAKVSTGDIASTLKVTVDAKTTTP